MEESKLLDPSNLPKVKRTNRRWLILFIFCTISFLTAFHWMVLAILPDISKKYFMVPNSVIIWTSTTYMVVYCCTTWFAAWLTESLGLRPVALLASGMCALGAGIKLISVQTRSFWVYELGQVMCAFAETFIVSLPARVASVWFPSDEISTATSIGVFGNQLGVALSFKLPTQIVTGKPEEVEGQQSFSSTSNATVTSEFYDEETPIYKTVREQLIFEHAALTIVGFMVFAMVVVFFKNEPVHPPSVSRARVLTVNDTKKITPLETSKSFVRLFKSRNFVLLCTGYGLLVGVYYALSAVFKLASVAMVLNGPHRLSASFVFECLLKQREFIPLPEGNIKGIIDPNLPDDIDELDKSQKIGDMGLIMIVAGVVASLFAGCILDAVKKFKAVSCIAYAVTLIMFITWTFILKQESIILDFIVAALLGSFMTGYLPIGFEFASEITWPESEATSSGFLNLAAMLVGAFLTPITQSIIGEESNPGTVQTANLVLCGVLLLGFVLTVFIKEDNRRQEADLERSIVPSTSKLTQPSSSKEDKVIEAR